MLKPSHLVVSLPYAEQVYSRGLFRYTIGLCVRFRTNLKYALCRWEARRRGATIGRNAVIPWALARTAGPNLRIGESTIIEPGCNMDIRGRMLTIGDKVIINSRVTLFRASHDVDDPYFATTPGDLVIEDYVWLCTDCAIMSRVSRIGRGAVVGAFAVVSAREVGQMDIVAGNPARVVRHRNQVHHQLVVESMRGGDLHAYWRARRWFRWGGSGSK